MTEPLTDEEVRERKQTHEEECYLVDKNACPFLRAIALINADRAVIAELRHRLTALEQERERHQSFVARIEQLLALDLGDYRDERLQMLAHIRCEIQKSVADLKAAGVGE